MGFGSFIAGYCYYPRNSRPLRVLTTVPYLFLWFTEHALCAEFSRFVGYSYQGLRYVSVRHVSVLSRRRGLAVYYGQGCHYYSFVACGVPCCNIVPIRFCHILVGIGGLSFGFRFSIGSFGLLTRSILPSFALRRHVRSVSGVFALAYGDFLDGLGTPIFQRKPAFVFYCSSLVLHGLLLIARRWRLLWSIRSVLVRARSILRCPLLGTPCRHRVPTPRLPWRRSLCLPR